MISLAAPQRGEAERVIAHLILSDPILIAAADRLLAGADTVATLLASLSLWGARIGSRP